MLGGQSTAEGPQHHCNQDSPRGFLRCFCSTFSGWFLLFTQNQRKGTGQRLVLVKANQLSPACRGLAEQRHWAHGLSQQELTEASRARRPRLWLAGMKERTVLQWCKPAKCCGWCVVGFLVPDGGSGLRNGSRAGPAEAPAEEGWLGIILGLHPPVWGSSSRDYLLAATVLGG